MTRPSMPTVTLLPSFETLTELNKALGLAADRETIQGIQQRMLEEYAELHWTIFQRKQEQFRAQHRDNNQTYMSYTDQMAMMNQAEQEALDILTEKYLRAPARLVEDQDN